VAVAFGGVLRPQDEDVGRIFDLAAGVARRLVDIGDALVGGIVRIDLTARGADHALIGADLAERGAVGQGFDLGDINGQQHGGSRLRYEREERGQPSGHGRYDW
jgi:hypothetical protein